MLKNVSKIICCLGWH